MEREVTADQVYPLNGAVKFLQELGFPEVNYNRLMHAVMRQEVTVIEGVKPISVTEATLERIIEEEPTWLTREYRPVTFEDGRMTVAATAKQYNLKQSRLYAAREAGVIPSELVRGSGHRGGTVHAIRKEDIHRLLQVSCLHDYLVGGEISLSQVCEKMKLSPATPNRQSAGEINRPDLLTESVTIVPAPEPPAEPTKAKIIDMRHLHMRTERPIDRLLEDVHNAQRLIARYQHGLAIGLNDEELVDHVYADMEPQVGALPKTDLPSSESQLAN